MNAPRLTVGSLFSGIGGFDLGLERAGFSTSWFCEQDEFCQRVLAKHWPGVPCYPDVSELSGAHVEPIDVLCGGFPCQDISLAGKGAGITGARSGLWSEFARLIGELRPRYVIVENVPALLGRGAGTVLGDLAAIGYDAEWDCLPASAFGAPHRRDRFWLVAYPDSDDGREGRPRGFGGAREDGQIIPTQGVADAECLGSERRGGHGDLAGSERTSEADCEQRQRNGDAPHDRRAALSDADRSRRIEQRRSEPRGTQFTPAQFGRGWPIEPAVGRVADGFPGRVDQLRSLGNALVPQIAEFLGRRILEHEQKAAA